MVPRQRSQRLSLVVNPAKAATSFCRGYGWLAWLAGAALVFAFVVTSTTLWALEPAPAAVGGSYLLESPMDLSPIGPAGTSTGSQGTISGENTTPPKPPAPSSPGGVTPGTSQPAAIQEVKPEQIYIRDVDGSLKLMLGWTMAQFEELVRLRDGLEQRNQAPPYVIEEIHVQGKCFENYAELSVRVRVRLRGDQPYKIPLRLEQLIPRELPRRVNGQPLLFSYSRQDGGYTLYVQGTADSVEEIIFQGWAPVSHVGSEARLVLSVPEAPISDLELDVPLADIEPSVTPGAMILGMDAVEGGRRLRVTGLGPGFVLTWTIPPSAAWDTNTVLESNGAISVRVTERMVDFDARLNVRSYGIPFDRFRVTLPIGARPLPFSSTSYTVQEVKREDQAGASQSDRTTVEVLLAKKTTGPVEVRLTAQCEKEPHAWIDIGGFSVEGAVRQSGYLSVMPSSDQALIWGEWKGVRQVSHIPTAANGEASETVVHLEYFMQPCTVVLKSVPRVAYVSIAPRYRVELTTEQARLQARLNYDVQGADVIALDIDLAGWQLQEALLGEQSTVLAVTGDPKGRATLALPQPMSGKLEITLLATRDRPLENKPLMLSFPQPKAQVVQPAEVLIMAPANLELRADYKESEGVEQALPQATEKGVSAVNVVSFRLNRPDARFVADWTTHEQDVSVDIVTRVRPEGAQLTVEQQIRYQVRYEPWTGAWRFRVPSGIEQITVLLDGRPVTLTPVAAETPTQSAAESEKPSSGVILDSAGNVFAVLPIGPILGTTELVFRYIVPGGLASPEATRWQIPLVDPLDGRLQQHRLSISASVGWNIESVVAPWQIRETTSLSAVSASQIECETKEHTTQIVLRPRVGTFGETNVVVVERMLLQTRLDRLMRQDRCAIRFSTRQPTLTLELPRGARSDRVQIWFDGRPVQARPTSRTSLIVPLTVTSPGPGTGETSTEHLLELWYELPRFRHSWGRTYLECLRLDPHAIVQRISWEIVLLPDEHIIWNGAEVTSEYRWGWTGYFWGRLPTISEENLERWAGVAEGWLHVSGQANRYLFGALRAVDGVNIWCLRRPWIVGGCSAAVVFTVLGLVYFGPLARKAVLLGAVVIVTTLVLLRPDVALLAGQASALGLALAILSLVLYRAVSAETAALRTNAWSERTALETVICPRTAEVGENCSPLAAERPTEVHR